MSVPPPPPDGSEPQRPPVSEPWLPPPPSPYGAPPTGAYAAFPPPGAYGALPAYPGGYVPQYQGAPFGVDRYGRPLSDKSKLVAALLQIFLGTFGIGRFYLGYTAIGIAQLAVSLLTCGIGAIWPFIDEIFILLDKVPDPDGRTLRE